MDALLFHRTADATLEHCFDRLDDAYECGALDDLSLEGGILTITTASGRSFIISKHAPSMQLWLASPLSGGLHFRFEADSARWSLPDGRTLHDVLTHDLAHERVEVTW